MRASILVLGSAVLFCAIAHTYGQPVGNNNLSGLPEGIVKPLRDQTLSAVVLGKIAHVNVQKGDSVEKGEVLIEMDRSLQDLELEHRRITMDNEAQLKIARERLEILKSELESTRELFEEARSISREEINRKLLDYQSAQGQVEELKRERRLAEVEYEITQEEIERRLIRAPHGGQITDVLVEEGEVYQPGQPLLEMVDASECYVECNLDADRVEKLELGQVVQIIVEMAGSRTVFEGEIRVISPVIDAASGLRNIRVYFDNSENRVAPGRNAYLVIGEPSA